MSRSRHKEKIADVTPEEIKMLAQKFKKIAGVISFAGDSLEFLGKD